MLMTIAIAAILTTIAIPSFRYITNSNRIASELNGLLGLAARTCRGNQGGMRTVTVCQSNDGATCTNSTSWQGGWIVFSDPINVGVYDLGETYLRKQKPFSGTDTFVASNNVSAITFQSRGLCGGHGQRDAAHACMIQASNYRLDPLPVRQPERTDDERNAGALPPTASPAHDRIGSA